MNGEAEGGAPRDGADVEDTPARELARWVLAQAAGADGHGAALARRVLVDGAQRGRRAADRGLAGSRVDRLKVLVDEIVAGSACREDVAVELAIRVLLQRPFTRGDALEIARKVGGGRPRRENGGGPLHDRRCGHERRAG